MNAVVHLHILHPCGSCTAAVFFRSHAALLLKCPGEIPVVGEAGFHTNFQHFFVPCRHQFTGTVEPDRIDIFLKGLIHGTFNKVRQVGHGTALCPGEVRQSNFVHIIFVHKPDQAFQSGISLVDAGNFLRRQYMGRHMLKQRVKNQANLSHTVKGIVILLHQICPHHCGKGILQPFEIFLRQIFMGKLSVSDKPAVNRQDPRGDLKARECGTFPDLVEFMGLIGAEKHHLTHLGCKAAFPASHGKRLVQHPDQLPLRMDMRGTVVNRI